MTDLKELRIRLNRRKQKDVCDMTGLSASTVNKFIRGQTPSLSTLQKIEDYLRAYP